MAIFSRKKLVSKLKYKLGNRCSNNQAEQLAIANALEALETTDIEENSPRTAAIITDSWISLDSINPYPTAFPYGNGMVLHFYQQQESSATKTVHKVINKGLKTYV